MTIIHEDMCEKVAWKSLAKRDRAKQERTEKNNCACGGEEKTWPFHSKVQCNSGGKKLEFWNESKKETRNLEPEIFRTKEDRDDFTVEQTKNHVLSDLHSLRDTLGLEGTKEWLRSEAAEFFTR